MLNQVVLVGRLTREIQINKADTGKKIANITLAVPRSFKNMDGLYDTDFIDSVATNTSEYCHKGDILGVKGRIQSRIVDQNDTKRNVLEVIAEKVTFLTSNNDKNKKNEK